jgi:hypothetical protein
VVAAAAGEAVGGEDWEEEEEEEEQEQKQEQNEIGDGVRVKDETEENRREEI